MAKKDINKVKRCALPSILMPPVYSFLDSSKLLAAPLTREGDNIHLGSNGISKLVSLLKYEIYHNLDDRKFNSRRQYTSSTNRSGSTKPG